SVSALTVGQQVLFYGARQAAPSSTGPIVVDIYDGTTGAWTATTLATPPSSNGYTTAVAGEQALIVHRGNSVRGVQMAVTVDIYVASAGTWSSATLSEP